MTRRRRRLVLATAGVLAGGAVPAAAAPLSISVPAPGATTTVRPHAGGWAVDVRVAGRAPARRRVRAEIPCGASACVAVRSADRHGRWSVDLQTVVATPRAPVAVTVRDLSRPARVLTRRLRLAAVPAVTTAPADAPTLVVTGDSLAVGTAPLLPGLLDGWGVSTLARVGRPLGEGMLLFDATPLPPGPRVVAFSLFTNDEPPGLPRLEAAIARSLDRAGPQGCAVWATIVRPPVADRSYAPVNRRLRDLAADPAHGGRLLLVDWARAIARTPSWRARDRVHATPAGYRARARMYADAARACPVLGDGGTGTPVAGDPGAGGVPAP